MAAETGTRISIGGVVASNIDFAKTIRDKLPLFIGVVVGLSLLLLMVVFRSILIPIKAGIFNLLSIAGAFGVVTLIFQDGNFASLFGDATGPIESFLPIMVFAVVFGLSMDYEVFLVSRMHEEWVHTKDAKYAVQPRPGDDRPRRHRGGDHHDRGLRRLRDRQRAGAGDDGRRLRVGDLHRRVHHPAAAAPGGHAPRRARRCGGCRRGSTSACRTSTSSAPTRTSPWSRKKIASWPFADSSQHQTHRDLTVGRKSAPAS